VSLSFPNLVLVSLYSLERSSLNSKLHTWNASWYTVPSSAISLMSTLEPFTSAPKALFSIRPCTTSTGISGNLDLNHSIVVFISSFI